MIYLAFIGIWIVSFLILGGIGKFALQKYALGKIRRHVARNIFYASMVLWYLTAITIATLIAFRISHWLGYAVGGIGILWLISSALPTLPKDAEHSLNLARDRSY
jgi:hypothetical protein